MNYELAKQLKNAGFTVGTTEMFCSECKQENPMCEHTSDKIEWLHVPALEELIEACGDEFILLKYHQKNKRWVAQSLDILTRPVLTPTEAVAKLWLALNKSNATQ